MARLQDLLAECKTYMGQEPPEVSTESLTEQAEHSAELWESLYKMQQELEVNHSLFSQMLNARVCTNKIL